MEKPLQEKKSKAKIIDKTALSHIQTISGASTLDSHVEINTSAKLLCYAWGLTRQLESVKWEKPAPGGVIIDGTDGYKIDVGTFNNSGDYQESILTIPASEVTADSTFTCVIQSLEHGIDGERVEANLLVFSKYDHNRYYEYF